MLRFRNAILLPIAAALASLASPADAQEEYVEATFESVGLAVILQTCIGALDGKVDLNDPAALRAWSLHPGSAELEANMRQNLPGLEVAEASFPKGSIFLGFLRGQSCSVQFKGEDRIAVRNALIELMRKTRIEYTAKTSATGAEVLTFPFAGHPIYVQTDTKGGVMVQVR